MEWAYQGSSRPMEVRKLGVDDVRVACELSRVFKDREVEPEYMLRFLSSPRNHLVVAFCDGIAAGFALGYETDRVDRDQTQMCLYEVDVHPNYRRRGVGRAVVNEMKRICKANNCVNMWVITHESNDPAKALYCSTGGARGDMADPPVVFEYFDFSS